MCRDTLLLLIGEELKIRKLFRGLQKAGFDDCYFEPHLDRIILEEMGLDDGSDETLERYMRIIEKRSKKIEADRESIMRQAWKVWRELREIRSRCRMQDTSGR